MKFNNYSDRIASTLINHSCYRYLEAGENSISINIGIIHILVNPTNNVCSELKENQICVYLYYFLDCQFNVK